VSQRRARSKKDEGAADAARALNVRVANELSASAAMSGPVESAGRRVPNAAPRVIGGRSRPGKASLMQRQPWWPAHKAGAKLFDVKMGRDWITFNILRFSLLASGGTGFNR
jgi:hypothetical protein